MTLSETLRAAARRFLGRAPSDWAGTDASRAVDLDSERIAPEAPFEVAWLGSRGDAAELDALRALALAGHRVFRVSAAAGPDAHATRESSPGVFDIDVPPDAERAFRALDAVRRERGLGATAAVVADPAWEAAAGRLARERGWAVAAAPETAGGRTVETTLAGAFPLASVVVVTHQNVRLNRLCLESLIARTEWPRLEIVVVDNASTDGTRELLRSAAASDERVSLLELPDNIGFPAAANAALARARGEILVLLNNDTVVTRGWLTALARHLSADARLGLVGPSTNAIANAARVDAGYRRLRDLPAWAAARSREHDGELEDIGSLAFFCVGMRRTTWERVGPLDERFGIGMFEDGDYCRRVAAVGLEVRCARDAFVHHWQMASFRRMPRETYLALFERNRRLFEEKWGR